MLQAYRALVENTRQPKSPLLDFLLLKETFLHNPRFRMIYLVEARNYQADSIRENIRIIWKYFMDEVAAARLQQQTQNIACMLQQQRSTCRVKFLPVEKPGAGDLTDVRNFSARYLPLLNPEAQAWYSTDADCDIISQEIGAKHFSIYYHEIFSREDLFLRPCSRQQVCSLHVIQQTGPCQQLSGKGEMLFPHKEPQPDQLKSNDEDGFMEKDTYRLSFYINILPSSLITLAKIHPALEPLARKATEWITDGTAPQAFRVNKLTGYLVRNIMDCRYTGPHAGYYLHRACIDLFLNFAAQEKWPGSGKHIRLTHAERASLHGILEQAQHDNILLLNLNALMLKYRLSRYKLSNGFLEEFGISLKDRHTLLNMYRAYELLLYSGKSFIRIAMEAGYSDSQQFLSDFSAWFGCDPFLLKGLQ